MYEEGEVNNIIHAGMIFILYLFIAILLYYALSYPINMIFDGFSAGSVGTASESYMTWLLPNVRWGLNVAFALFMALPVAWFVLWIFSQEPDFSMFRRQ